MYSWNWADICRTKVEGGFGIRRPHNLCPTVGLKMVWRLHTANSLWSNWMHARYLKNICYGRKILIC